jgi:hypothetical protein
MMVARYFHHATKGGSLQAIVCTQAQRPRRGNGAITPVETRLSAPQLIRRWRRRTWIEFVFRTLKHLLATEACQGRSEDAYYGHLVLRLMGSFILLYTARVICKGRLTMEEIIFALKHYWRFVDLEPLE